MQKKNIVLLGLLFFTAIIILGVYSQFAKKEFISAVVQYDVDLNNPPGPVFAITTSEQKLNDGTIVPKGTRLSGRLSKEDNLLIVSFEGKNFTGKAKLLIKSPQDINSVSAKIGKTLYQQTRTNVLGAIFHNDSYEGGQILPRGSPLKIELQ